MKTIFKKVVACVSSLALAASLLVGVSVVNTTEVKADTLTLTPWNFFQTGTTTDDWNAWELCAYSSVATTAGEEYGETDFPHGTINTAASGEEVTVTTAKPADGFTAVIESNGWSSDYDNNMINPYTLTAYMEGIEMEDGHEYTISFKAKADPAKLAYVAISNSYTESLGGSIISIGTSEAEYTYTIQNYASGATLNFTFMFGAFIAGSTDYDGTDLSSIIGEGETNYAGTVYISDFTITDNGLIEGYVPVEKEEEPDPVDSGSTNTTNTTNSSATGSSATVSTGSNSASSATATTSKLAKVKKVKAKNNKAGKIKITWKKVTNAKKYSVKVGKKTYKTKKTKLTVKATKGKTYTVKVRAMKANGYAAGKWSKKVKVKVTK